MSSSTRLLVGVSDSVFQQFVGDAALAELAPFFGRIDRISPEGLTAGAWASRLRDLRPDAVLTGWGTPALPADVVPPVRYVAHTAGAVRHTVTREMIERGLLVTNWGPGAAPSVAEHALLLVLASLRRMTYLTLGMHVKRDWRIAEADAGVGLYGRRVGVHGFGVIARQFVKLIQPFGCDIQAYSKGVPAAVFAEQGVAQAASLDALFARSEVLVEVEALTDASRGSVDERVLRLLPPGAAFVNVGRGAVVDYAGLCAVAAEGRLQVALDVFSPEPLPADSPLRGLPNVTLTPHVAGPTVDRRKHCGRIAVENLKLFAKGQPPHDLITPEVFDRLT